MVDSRREVDLGWLERVIGREVDCEEKDAARVRRLRLHMQSSATRAKISAVEMWRAV